MGFALMARRKKSAGKDKPEKRPVGHPRKFATAEALQTAIDTYFDKCKAEEVRPGVCALALELGFADRQSLYDCEKIHEYSCIIKRARLRVESSYEDRLSEHSCAGAIFALKNMGWHDKTEQDITTGGEKISGVLQVELVRPKDATTNT